MSRISSIAAAPPSLDGRHPLPDPADFAATLGRLGLNPEDHAVVYDDAGGAVAARLWWMLRSIGHERVQVLDGGDAVEIQGVGFAGVKGFAGGFGRRALGPWGEETIKLFVREAVEEALKLETSLSKLRTDRRVVLLHYSPIAGTVEGEPKEIYPYLGSSRLEEPLIRYPVDVVFHGHAHHGTLEGKTLGGVSRSRQAILELNGVSHFAIWKTIDDQRKGVTNLGRGGYEINFRDTWKNELPAYELDKMLGVKMVPVAVSRTFQNKEGALIAWVDLGMSEADRLKKQVTPPNPADWSQKMANVQLFDNLIYNIDRHSNNIYITKDWNVILIDHSRAFRTFNELRAETELPTAAVGPGSLISTLQDERNFSGVNLLGLNDALTLNVTSFEEARANTDAARAQMDEFLQADPVPDVHLLAMLATQTPIVWPDRKGPGRTLIYEIDQRDILGAEQLRKAS